MSKSLSLLLDNINLEKIELNIFRGSPLDSSVGRVYGGQVLAQAINAAQRTVASPYILHSLHAYFLRMGDSDYPIVYEVDRIRDGKTYVTRRVEAIQHGRAIFHVSLSFHLPEDGFDHQPDMPDVPAPEALINDQLFYIDKLGDKVMGRYRWPIEYRQVAAVDPTDPQDEQYTNYVWFKADGHLADDVTQHQEILAYASDNHVLSATLRPHQVTHWSDNMRVASLDHAIWFHRDFLVDDWLLYEIEGYNAKGGRGFSRGRIFDKKGRLVASTSQEGMIRNKT